MIAFERTATVNGRLRRYAWRRTWQRAIAVLVSLVAITAATATAQVPLPATASGNLSLWLDGNTGLTTSSGTVTAWADQSGNNRTVTVSGSLTTAATNWGNGGTNTAVVFNGNAANNIALPSTNTLGIALGNYEMFVVGRQPTASSGAVQFLVAGSTIGDYEMHLNVGTNTGGMRFIPDGSFSDYSGINSRWGQVYAGRVTGATGIDASGTGTGSINGLDGNAVTGAAAVNNTSLFLGRRGDGSFLLNGQIAEVLIYNRALTTAERAQVNNYLATKYFAAGMGWDADGAGTSPNGGTGTWNTSAARWWDYAATTPTYSAWSNAANKDATLYASGTVTLGEAITANSLTFHPFLDTDTYTVTGQTLTLSSGRINSPGTATIASVIAGTNGLTKTGDGTVTLSGSNSYTGGTTISGGTLQVGAGSTAGSIPGDVTNNAALVFNRSDDMTYSGAISGTGILRKIGAGRLNLSGANSLTGATTVAAGTLAVNGSLAGSAITVSGGALGGSGTVGVVTIAAGGTIAPGNSPGTLTTGAMTWAGGGAYDWQLYDAAGSAGTGWDFISGTGGLSINAASGNTFTLNLLTLSGTNPDVAGNALNFNSAASGTWALGSFTSIAGFDPAAFSINPAGFTNPRSGLFSLATSGGTLNLVYAPSSDYTYTAGTGDWSTAGNWSGAVSPSGVAAITFTGTGGTTTNDISASTLAGVAGLTFSSGAGSYVVAGPVPLGGAVTNNASAAQTLAGGVSVISASSLNAASGGIVITGTITTNGFPLTTLGSGTVTVGDGGAIVGNVTANGVLAFNRSNAVIQSGTISGSGSLVKLSTNALTLSGSNSYSGGTTFSAGRLNVNNASALGTGTFTIAGSGTLDNTSGSAITLSTNNRQAWNADFTFAGTNPLNLGTGTVTLSANRQVTVTSSTLTIGGPIGGAFSLTKAGAGALTLSASNSYSGVTTVTAGTLALNGAGSTATTGTVALTASGAAFDISAASGDRTIGMLSGAAGSIVALGGRTLTVGDATSGTFAGRIGGTGGLTKVGGGLLALSGSSSYSGATTLNSGTLAFATNALGTGSVALNGGTLRWELGNTQDISSRLTIGSGSAATIDIGANNVTFAGAFGAGSTGSLTKLGAGRLTLTGTAGYSGATTIASGTLQIGNGGTSGVIAGNVVNNGVLVLNRSDSVTLPGVVSGSGAVIQAGPGTIVFGGSSSFTGGMTVSAGAVTARNASALGSGAVTVAADGRLNVNAAGAAVSNDLALGGGTVSSFLASSNAATGGTFTTTPDGLYGLNTFTAGSGTFSGFTGTVDVLVVGGGGGGGSRFGGGGGAGGVIYQQGFQVSASVPVTVGAGGAGGAATGGAGTGGANPGANGQNSVFGSLVAFGGGGGGQGDANNGLAGGSGGGGAGRFGSTGGSGTSSQGFAGGSSTGVSPYVGGGGGGAGGAGSVSGTNGAGGIGRLISITGNDVYYGGGGGGGGSGDGSRAGGTGGSGGGGTGGHFSGTPAATTGTANTGGGGGGGAYLSTSFNQAGAAGGSGVVIVRYVLLSGVNDLQTLSGGVTVNATSTLDAVRGSGGLRFTGAMSGAGGLTIASTGSGAAATVIFDGAAKSYAGPTVIAAGGDLRVNSDNSLATGAVTVNGRLGGSGILGGAVTVNSGGVLSPGNSIESLSTGTVSFSDGSTYEYEVDSSVAFAVGADFTKALGNLSLSGSVALSFVDLATSPAEFAAGTTFSLFNYTGSWNGGLFSVDGTPVADGGSFTVGLNTWRIDYNAPTGGSNYASEYTTGSFVNVVVVPEPGAVALALGGIAAAAAWRRRRR